MTDPRSVVRAVVVYSLCIPLAVMLGYMLATPLDFTSFVSIGLVFALLLTPVLLRWHYPLLLLSWNTIAIIPFLPGQPQVRALLTGISLLITWLMYGLDRRVQPQNVRGITFPLMALSMVLILTMWVNGGVGFRALGAQAGGAGRYVFLAGAILGYFAISARPVPVEKANLYVGIFFLGGLTLALSTFAYLFPRWMTFLFYVFPVEDKFFSEGPTVFGVGVSRAYGIALASMMTVFYFLARFGLRDIFDTRKPWRALLFLGCCTGVLFGGYRSFVLLLVGVIGLQAYLEDFFRMKYLPVWILVTGLGLSIWPLAGQLPYQVQRSFAFLPWLPVANEVAVDVRGSTEWRKEIWERVLRDWMNSELKHRLVGKGFRFDTRAFDEVVFRNAKGATSMGESAEFASDYHSGPLTVIVPLGILGAAALIWFWYAGWRFLLHNYRHGPPELAAVNTLLLAYFVVRIFHFIVIFGNFYSEFAHFTGLVGLSVALNGVATRVQTVPAEAAVSPQVPPRTLRFPVSPPASAKS